MSYAEVSAEYLAGADEAIQEGEFLQASGKLWGGAAQMVKAVASQRGWRHDSHAALYQIVERLTDETGDSELHAFFLIAGQLHTNFYENWLPPDAVVRARDEVGRLVGKLEGLLDAQG